MTNEKLPNKVERLKIITPWVDRIVADAAKLPKQDSFPREIAVLDLVPATETDAQDMGFLGMVAFKRAQFLRLPLTIAALLAVTYMSDRPGAVVMYITVLKHLHAAETLPGHEATRVTYAQIVDLFPSPPGPEFMERHWDGQKYKGVNVIDLMGADDFLLTPEEAAAEAAKEA